MGKKLLQMLIYLWTRDAGMLPTDETEEYVLQHLRAFDSQCRFSDKKRRDMAIRILSKLGV